MASLVIVVINTFFPCAIALITAYAYYKASGGSALQKLSIASPGVLIVFATVYATIVSFVTGNLQQVSNFESYVKAFQVCFMLFGLSLVYSLVRFRGPLVTHLLQLLLIPSALWIYFVGMVLITHDGP